MRTLAFLTLAIAAYGQTGAKNGEWPTYGADLGNTRYSPLTQIDATNFNKLEIAWRFKTDNLGPRPEYQARRHAAHGEWRCLHHRRLAPRRHRARRRHRRAASGSTAKAKAPRG